MPKDVVVIEEEQAKPHIVVKTLTDKAYKIDWSDELTVGAVRERHLAKEGIPGEAKVLYQGAVLADSQALASVLPPVTADNAPTLYVFYYHKLGTDPIETAKDWDQKNRLKFFKGLHRISTRSFEEAGELLVGSLPTFTETQFLSFKECVKYAILAACLTFDRPSLSKLIKAPEVVEVIDKMPGIRDLLMAYYQCHYERLFVALAAVEADLARDWLMGEHSRFFVKEMRIRAYKQILRSYKSLSIASMAHAFGVTVAFIDRELSRFIASGRINAVIDQVAGTIITNTADPRDAEHADFTKEVDGLLNRIQKLNRVVSY